MEKELLNQSYDNIFYSIIGKHAGEDVEEIIKRKQKEIEDCKYSLWSAQIDKKSIEQVWKLKNTEKVYVLCRINRKAKDPVKITETPYYAKKAYGPNQPYLSEIIIPDSIRTSFTKGKKYQAYVVEKYILLIRPIEFNFGIYESVLRDNTRKSFKERFKFSRFQNTFGYVNDKLVEKYYKEIELIMELKYPFVVNLE